MKQEFKRNEVVFENEVFRFHKFNEGEGVPVFVVPPHAGRHGNVAQNLIDAFVKEGRIVYSYELLPCTKDTSIEDLINILYRCCKYIDEPVNLIGLCQGAWLSAMFTSLHQDMVKTYTNSAGPINTKTGCDNIIEKYMEIPFVYDYHKMVVNFNGGIQPGILQWLAFSFVNPVFVYQKRWFDGLNTLCRNNEEEIKKWKKNNDWYDYPIDLSGNWFLNCLKNHFLYNRLYNGSWRVFGKEVNLKNITCPVYLYAGDKDDITHWRQVFDMGNVISSKEIYKILFEDAGHTKSFCGKEEVKTIVNNLKDY